MHQRVRRRARRRARPRSASSCGGRAPPPARRGPASRSRFCASVKGTTETERSACQRAELARQGQHLVARLLADVGRRVEIDGVQRAARAWPPASRPPASRCPPTAAAAPARTCRRAGRRARRGSPANTYAASGPTSTPRRSAASCTSTGEARGGAATRRADVRADLGRRRREALVGAAGLDLEAAAWAGSRPRGGARLATAAALIASISGGDRPGASESETSPKTRCSRRARPRSRVGPGTRTSSRPWVLSTRAPGSPPAAARMLSASARSKRWRLPPLRNSSP